MATAVSAEKLTAQRTTSLRGLVQIHDFRLLWIGQGTSLLGDQFYMIALPWLVLKLTGDPVALGIVLALAGIPRALFMLVGGAVTDRFSARSVMIASDVVRLVLITLLAVIVLTGQVQLWMLYILALVLGTVSGFFMPASNAIMPRLIPTENLQTANALFQGTAQFSVFIGPALAGALIALASGNVTGTNSAANMTGMALAFGFDALTFVVSIVTLWKLNVRSAAQAQKKAADKPSLLAAIGEIVRYAWQDPLLRMMFVIIAAMNLLFAGPLLVGIPVLANTRLPEGAAAFGIIVAAYGGGNLLGYIVAGIPSTAKHMGVLIFIILGAFGIGLILIGLANSTAFDFAILFALGIGNGCIVILVVTWLQKRTPPAMLGRMMSLFLFFNMGLVPVSQALCGFLIKWSILGVFVGAGILTIAVTVRAAFMPEMRMMGTELKEAAS